MAAILVIDDDDDFLRYARDVLVANGHSVATAADGAQGLRQARAHAFDLVITDILMPERDGFEVIMALARRPGAPPIIAVSTRMVRDSDADLLQLAEGLGAARTFWKPISREQLIEAVSAVLSTTGA